MDIWKWVQDTAEQLREAGNYRLAELIFDLPADACHGRLALAQAALPEAIAGARAAGIPWLEVYFRHWVINSRVCTNKEGDAALKDAVALFEYAHRPETIGCPQSVCTTQDIASCYGNVDGPGYANERIAVCKETLGRIDSSWGCFRCISVEMIDALVDGARHAEGLEFAGRQMPFLQESGNDKSADVQFAIARARLGMGEFEAALSILDMIDEGDFGDDEAPKRHVRSCTRFRLLAALGRHEEAWAALPSAEQGDEFGETVDLCLGLEQLLQAEPQRNDFKLGRRTAAAVRRYSSAGAHRLTLEALAPHVRLAVARGARWAAAEALALAKPHLEKLRLPLGAPEAFAELEALVRAMPVQRELPVATEDAADYIRAQCEANPEQGLELALSALLASPSDEDLALLAAASMKSCGGTSAAGDFLWNFLRHNRSAESVATELLATLLDARDESGVKALSEFLKEVDPVKSHWCLARLAFVTEAWAAVGPHAQRVLELLPNAVIPRRMWADAAARSGDHETALSLFDGLAAEAEKPGSDHWDAIVAASALQRWDRVRALAPALGMELEPGEGPVEEAWGPVRIRYDEDGDTMERFARRTGPATARVVTLSGIHGRQTAGELVVFDPAPLEDDAENDEGEERPIRLYKAVKVIEESGYGSSYLVDGVNPGEAAFNALTGAFDERGWKWSIRSDDDYEVYDQEAEVSLQGIYFVLAAPLDTPAATVDRALHDLTADFEHPMSWRGLAEAAGADVSRHEEVMERYTL